MKFALHIFVLTVVPAALYAGVAADDRSLARLAPADTGLFVEVIRAEDLLVPLTETHVWLTLADLAGQPAKESDAREWRARIKQTIDMDPAEAIRKLFARRVAFVGQGPGRAQDGVVICRPAPKVDVNGLVRRWSAESAPKVGDMDVFKLPNNVGLAVYDGSLIFGDAGAGSHMFARVLSELAKGRRGRILADDPLYTALLRRVPADPDGILFARLSPINLLGVPTSAPATSQPTTLEAFRQAMPDLPGPFRGSPNLLMVLHREKNLLHFTAVGSGASQPGRGGDRLPAQVRSLPQRTLLATGAHVDFPALIAAAQKLPRRNLMRVVLNLLRIEGPLNPFRPLLNALESSTSIAIGAVAPGNRDPRCPPMAAAAVIIATDKPVAVAQAIERLVELAVSVYNLGALIPNANTPRLPEIVKKQFAGVDVRQLDLGALLANIDKANLIGELHLCWAVDDSALVVASHIDWLEQILLSRAGKAPDLSTVFDLVQRPVPAGSETLLVVQTGPISDLAGMWLDYLRETMPHVLSERYWRGRQPGGLVVKIGIDGTRDAEQRRLVITRVDQNAPAANLLQPGDALIGINGRRFATSQPIKEFQEGMRQRPNASWVTLMVQTKSNGVVSKTIPLPFVDPMELMRRARAIGKIGQRVIYYDDVPDPAGPRGFLTVELRASQKPLFSFPKQPASQSEPRP